MRGGGLRIYAILYLIFLYGPILILPLFAFNNGTIIAFPLKGFTTEWFVQMTQNETLRRAFLNSLTIAISSSILATALGVFAARATASDAGAGVRQVAFHPAEHLLVSTGYDQTVRLWDVVKGVHLKTLHGHALSVSHAAFNASGHLIVSGGKDATKPVSRGTFSHEAQSKCSMSGRQR